MSQEIKSPEEFAENLELLLQALVENTQSTDVNLERLKNESMNHKEDLARLLKVVVDGNGQPPILTRLAVIENKIEDTQKDIDKYSSRLWQLFMATVPGILASIGLVNVKWFVVVITHHLVMEEDGQAANQEMQQLIF